MISQSQYANWNNKCFFTSWADLRNLMTCLCEQMIDDTYHTSLEPRPQHVAMMMRARHRAINSALWCNTKHNSATFYCTLDNFHTGSSVKRVSNVKWIFMRNEQLVTYCCSNSSFLVNLVPETWYPVHYGEPEEAASRAKVSRKFCGTQYSD